MSYSMQSVIDVATVDQQIYSLRRDLKKLERQIEEERTKVDQLNKKIAKQTSELEETEQLSHVANHKLSLEEGYIHKLEEQVPLVRTQKEFVASKKQLEEARRQKGKTEDEILEYDLKKEEHEKALADLNSQLETAKGSFDEDAQHLVSQYDAEIAKLKELEDILKVSLEKLDPKMSKFYKSCVKRGLSPPICEVVEQTCTGCHVVVPPQLLNDLIATPDQCGRCPHCTRAIYYRPPAEEK